MASEIAVMALFLCVASLAKTRNGGPHGADVASS
jgi:hypothetical protein